MLAGVSAQADDNAQPATKPAVLDAKTLFAKASPAVVKILMRSGNSILSTGSGFLVDAYGTIITNHHVIKRLPGLAMIGPEGKKRPVAPVGAARRALIKERDAAIAAVQGKNSDIIDRKREIRKQYEERLAGRTPKEKSDLFAHVHVQGQPSLLVATVIAVDRKMDLAVIRVNGKKLPFLKLQKAPPEVGEKVYTIGSPHGLTNTLSDGLVSGLRREGGMTLIQTSAPISHGSSGGPLLNSGGEVLGVTTSGIIKGENLGFAVPAATVSRLVKPFLLDIFDEAYRTLPDDKLTLTQLLRRKEDLAQILLTLAMIYVKGGADYEEEAREALKDLIAQCPNTRAAANARVELEKLGKRKPNYENNKARSQLALARTYARSGLKAKAIEILKALIARYPKTRAATSAQAELKELGKQ